MKTLITPETAMCLLDNNLGKQRALKPRYIGKLIEEMKKGNWEYNGESIIISATGKIIDGQHRLTAVLKSGVSITTELVNGVPDSAINTVGTGVTRSAGDVLKIHGVKNYKPLAAVIKSVMSFNAKSHSLSGHSGKQAGSFTNSDIVNFYDDHKDIADYIWHKESFKYLARSEKGFFNYIFSMIDKTIAYDFMNSLENGENLAKGSPILALRKTLERDYFSKKRATRQDRHAWVLRAFDKYIQGKNCTILKGVGTSGFPYLEYYPNYNV